MTFREHPGFRVTVLPDGDALGAPRVKDGGIMRAGYGRAAMERAEVKRRRASGRARETVESVEDQRFKHVPKNGTTARPKPLV